MADGPVPEDALKATALLFVHALRTGLPEALAELADYPFLLDGERVATKQALTERLRAAFGQADLSALTFYGLKTYDYPTMVRLYGQPPRRLSGLDFEDTWVTVANIGGHGYVGVFRKKRGRWYLVAYTD
ncbi:MAG: hypothetical protein D6729_02035 [Deltaproteobacteria bacterium]|nr:MAG: hypothetical protein D6729_02035 [Deltaproteobacteria bacterium]